MRLSTHKLLPMTALAFLAFTGVAMAKVTPLHAKLKPAAGVTSKGTGTMTGRYNSKTHMLYWHVTYSHLSSKVTAAHFHGPAKPGANGPVLVPISGPHASPINGKAKITSAEAKTILGGMSYVNVHTVKVPAGEIRGQVMEGK
ncbi:CHRD domain-containing protein [Acidiphilium iwatense]|uniref:CHRD domain-containing protein n=1 Tax=Acidiphilium iwatense TaxID=768198 RepID=A0ABS9DYB8_9PROT|nr:CHRD domain-containing protein [Acidiphilium iwatense]MCF3946319.1 CHRD domain-containing protein [Acidiphilium iwatense]